MTENAFLGECSKIYNINMSLWQHTFREFMLLQRQNNVVEKPHRELKSTRRFS